jgi:hypothetical protein
LAGFSGLWTIWQEILRRRQLCETRHYEDRREVTPPSAQPVAQSQWAVHAPNKSGKPLEPGVFGFVHHTGSAAAKSLDDAVMA